MCMSVSLGSTAAGLIDAMDRGVWSLWCLDVVIIHRFSWCITVMEEEDHHSLKHSSFALSALWDLLPNGLHADVGWQLAFTPRGVDGG